MPSRPTIGVYTCVLNEAKHVERWADTARCADHLLMLDTGSTDSTVALARSCGIEVHEAVIRPFRFDDARNIAMALIPSTVDIVIQLDADEVFSESNWRRHLDFNANHERWSYTLKGGFGISERSNCVRRTGYRWKHPIHEVISGPPATCHLDLVIEHHPDLSKPREYLPMLEDAAADGDPRMMFYLGREYRYLNRWDDGRRVLWDYVRHPEARWGAELSEAYLLIAEMASEPLGYLWKAVAACPSRREPFYFLAKHHARNGDHDLAWAMIQQAAKLTTTPYTTRAEAWGDQFDRTFAAMKKKAA